MNRMKRRLLTILCLSMLACSMTGCQGGAESAHAEAMPAITASPEETPNETAAEEEKEVPIQVDTDLAIEKGARIAVVAKTTDSDYWKHVKKHMQKAVDYLNQVYGLEGEEQITMTFEGSKSEDDVTTQINTIDAVLAENPSVLCLAANDANSCEAQLETAQENGIPVIMFDSSVSSDLVETYCGTNNLKAGRTAADKLCKAIGNEGEVAVIAHEKISHTSKERVRGFSQRIKNRHSDVTISSVVYRNEEEDLKEQIQSVLEENQQLKGIFCTSGPVAEEVLSVLKDYPDRQIQMVGFDSGDIQKKAIADGIEFGTIAQDTYRMAYETIWAAVRSTVGEKDDSVELEDKIYIDYVWINQKNLDNPKNVNFLYD